MRPSMPRSPTCVLFGMPPRATTAQFSNSNGGYLRNSASVFGKSRTMKPRPMPHSFSSSGSGALDAFVIALGSVLCTADGCAVVGEVLHEIGGEFVGDEFCNERGFVGFLLGSVAVGFLNL